MNVDPENIKSWFEAASVALRALKAAKDFLPSGAKKQEAEKAIEAAERDLQLTYASAAKELDFDLCRRHFPPGIMVLNDDGVNVCRDCGKPDPGTGGTTRFRTY